MLQCQNYIHWFLKLFPISVIPTIGNSLEKLKNSVLLKSVVDVCEELHNVRTKSKLYSTETPIGKIYFIRCKLK